MKLSVISTSSLYLCLNVYFVAFLHKSGSVVSEQLCSFSVFLCMSPMRSGYKEFKLDLVAPFQDQSRQPRRPPMAEGKRDEGAGDPIKNISRGGPRETEEHYDG